MKMKMYIIAFLVVGLMVSGCKKESTADIANQESKPAVITLLGDNPFFMGVGNEFVEPGVEVEGGELISTDVNVSPTVPGAYYVEYTARNSDGLTTTTRRKVVAVENYVPFTFGDFSSGTYIGGRPGYPDVTITVKQIATGVLYISDVLFGYYDLQRGYGPDYAAPGILNHLGNDVYQFLEAPTCNFGPVSVDPATVVITGTSLQWNPNLDDYDFNFGGNIFSVVYVP